MTEELTVAHMWNWVPRQIIDLVRELQAADGGSDD